MLNHVNNKNSDIPKQCFTKKIIMIYISRTSRNKMEK
jgi:hypothetical protein